MTRPGQAPGPDPFDADLSAARNAVDDIGVWLTIWQARREPDAFARRRASDAIDAADNLLAAAHRIRAQLVTEVRSADDEAAARADELLARMRDGPPVPCHDPGDRQKPQTSPRLNASTGSVDRGGDTGLAPREAAP
jgi:hypothetical protein